MTQELYSRDEYVCNLAVHSYCGLAKYKNKDLTTYDDLIVPITLGVHFIDKLSCKIDDQIPNAFTKDNSEMKSLLEYSCIMPWTIKDVLKYFADGKASLTALVLQIYDEYFQLMLARVQAIKNKKE